MLNHAEDALDQVTSGRDGDRGMRGLWKPVQHTYLLARGLGRWHLLAPPPHIPRAGSARGDQFLFVSPWNNSQRMSRHVASVPDK